MIMFKLIQKYKISYDGPELGVSYNGNIYIVEYNTYVSVTTL